MYKYIKHGPMGIASFILPASLLYLDIRHHHHHYHQFIMHKVTRYNEHRMNVEGRQYMIITRKLSYRKDDLAMGTIGYMVALKIIFGSP